MGSVSLSQQKNGVYRQYMGSVSVSAALAEDERWRGPLPSLRDCGPVERFLTCVRTSVAVWDQIMRGSEFPFDEGHTGFEFPK